MGPQEIGWCFAQLPALALSITADNRKEFCVSRAKSLKCDVYFAHPDSSWKRGQNENTNGLLHQYFPQSTNFNEVTNSEEAEAIKIPNDRPRTLLGLKTAAYLMQQEMAALAA